MLLSKHCTSLDNHFSENIAHKALCIIVSKVPGKIFETCPPCSGQKSYFVQFHRKRKKDDMSEKQVIEYESETNTILSKVGHFVTREKIKLFQSTINNKI